MRLLYFSLAAFLFTHYCEARISMMISHPENQYMKHLKILELAKNLNMLMDVSVKDASNAETLPPYDSLPPVPLPDSNNTPPFCVYPTPNPQSPPSPTTTIPSPAQFSPNPPLSPIGTVPYPTTPEVSPNPPIIYPGPPEYVPNPPTDVPGYGPSPPYYEPSPPSGGSSPGPPEYVPSPIGFEPSPPVFEPPVVYPPPAVPPPASSRGGGRGPGVWCVAKPAVPDPILQEAMNYACGSGADCGPIQPNGSCFRPDTLLEHASYAFNSFWQRTKVAGGTCSFGGTAILVTADPSSQGCRFENY